MVMVLVILGHVPVGHDGGVGAVLNEAGLPQRAWRAGLGMIKLRNTRRVEIDVP